jgi:hypothetical protein
MISPTTSIVARNPASGEYYFSQWKKAFTSQVRVRVRIRFRLRVRLGLDLGLTTVLTLSATPNSNPNPLSLSLFTSQPNEFDYFINEIDGDIPMDLEGTLFRNRPALFERG